MCKNYDISTRYCLARNQPIHPKSTLAETCPAFEERPDKEEALKLLESSRNNGHWKEAQDTQNTAVAENTVTVSVKTGTILDKLPSAIDTPKPEPSRPKTPKKETQNALETFEWRKELIETALKLYDYGFNIAPVNRQKQPIASSWSADKRIPREELEAKLKEATGIALIGKDLNPFDYRLVLIDIDNPRTALSKSPKLRELVEYSVSWKTGLRCPQCGDKHLEALENARYRCQKCGYEFSLGEVKERGLGVLVLIDRAIADKYGLAKTIRKGDVEFLVTNYQLLPPSLHAHGVKYEWINAPELGKPTAGIMVLSEEDLKKLFKELEVVKEEESPTKPQAETVKQGQLRELEDSNILRAKEILKTVYVPGFRQSIWLYFSGWGVKAGISPISIARILKMLYEETQDTDNLKTRAGALVYTYGKAGINLETYKDALKELFGEEPYGLMNKFNPENIKGFTGLQELAENVFKQSGLSEEEAEEKALEIIRSISEIFKTASPYRDSIFETMNYEKQIYAVVNLNKLLVVRARKTKDGLKYMEKVFIGAPTKVIEYSNPIGGVTKYEIVWEVPGKKPLRIGPAYVDEILDRLKAENLVVASRFASDVFASIMYGYERRGLTEIKSELESPGFYYLEGKLVAVKVDVEKPSQEELKESLELLNELGTKWYSHIPDKFSAVIQWGAIAPFIFAYKQKYNRWIRLLYLYGASRTSKTTLGEIILSMWGLTSRYMKSGATIDTVARLGYILSFSTFPTVINEPGGALSKEDVVEVLKSSIESVTARGKYHKGNYIDIPALSPLIFTSNRYVPRDEALVRRLKILRFTYGERLPEEKIKEFEEKVKPRLEKLAAIGKYIASRIMAEGLQEDLIAQGRRLLEEAYKEVGLTPPSLLYLETSETEEEDIYEDMKERIRGFLLRRINEEYNRFVGRVAVQTETNVKEIKREDTDLKQRIGIVIEQQLIPWLFGKGEEVYITSGIIPELEKEIGDIGGLKSLAELLGWGYDKKSIRIQGKIHTNYLIYTKLETFMEFLAIDIAEENTAEN
jgi:ribosomal protein S27AE